MTRETTAANNVYVVEGLRATISREFGNVYFATCPPRPGPGIVTAEHPIGSLYARRIATSGWLAVKVECEARVDMLSEASVAIPCLDMAACVGVRHTVGIGIGLVLG